MKMNAKLLGRVEAIKILPSLEEIEKQLGKTTVTRAKAIGDDGELYTITRIDELVDPDKPLKYIAYPGWEGTG